MPKALKAMDMRFHWLRCREAQGQFRYYWRPSTQNLADYFTKHHPASHHKASKPTYLTSSSDPQYKKLFLTSPEKKSTVTIHKGFHHNNKILREITAKNRKILHHCTKCLSNLRQGCVRPTKVGNAVMAGMIRLIPNLNLHLGLGNRQNHKTP
jgi:hypothetical protein